MASDDERKSEARVTPDNGSPTVVPGSAAPAPSPSGSDLTFPGIEAGDTAANAGDSVTIDNVTRTTTAVFEVKAEYTDTQYLCTVVTVKNDGEESIRVDEDNWKLQNPRGTLETSMTPASRDYLESGEIAGGGGVASGEVCFPNRKDAPGTYVVLYDPSSYLDPVHEDKGRIGWINSR